MRFVLHGNPNFAGFFPQPRNGRCNPGLHNTARGLDAERLFDALLRDVTPQTRRNEGASRREQRVGLRVQTWATSDAWLFRAEVPGVSREQVEVAIDGNVLTLRARRTLDAPEGFRLLRGERRGTEALARFELPPEADADSIGATLRDGILEVRVARRTSGQKRSIPVVEAAANAAVASTSELGNDTAAPVATAADTASDEGA